ncbi:Acetoacetate decarboxylase (ADC) [Roseovarius albus]|uniref:Acetoacetate decarboxylase (ADC) n=1 Tax=Roseovarius albus TaxID=1247867 RepID=A0A1X6ZY06_9RHOB|nr:NAD(P)-binding protein [Roseovarius albus]SLN64405.1 Acetoacetate decarboxylase (ADC) [Roseovarius albus]
MTSHPQKVAVIGGGVGAITAVYAITQLPDWQKSYDITLYQLGWRLGGKGASGRNAKEGQRIEEHGLHIWAGFYENGFRLMRDCYETLNTTGLRSPDAPLGTLDKAFHGLNHFLLADEIPQPDGSKQLRPWRFDFEPNDDKPGSGGVLPTPFAYFQMAIETIIKLLQNEFEGYSTHHVHTRFHPEFKAKKLPLSAPTPLHHLHNFTKALNINAFTHTASETLYLKALTQQAQNWHDDQLQRATSSQSDESRRMGYLISLSLAFFKGTIDNGLFLKGFDEIDNWEISDWLLHYGASNDAVYSAVFRGCYDYVFGYPGGVTDHRSVGAGTAIRGLLRLAFTYKGSLFFKMQAGMGDTIFGPYYQVLKERGVKFKYFNAATNLSLGPDQNSITAIDMVEQAEVLAGDYDPLVDVQNLPCWPSEPLWDQLKDGAKLEKSGIDFECEKDVPKGRAYRLEKGRDFDLVILGASMGSLPYMTQELSLASNRWRRMIDKVPTVATHAAQFWTTKTPAELGWEDLVAKYNKGDQSDLKTVITSFAEPLDTWADMSDLLPHEDWGKDGPTALAYFCSPCHDAGVDKGTIQERVRAWADTELTRMWPGALKRGKFDASILHATNATTPKEKYEGQYFRENFYGSERYVLSVPGSVQYRLPPDGSGFENLYLAGDWTRCGINAGCVEAATISGLVCARGLTGADIEVVGEGDLGNDAGPTDDAKLAIPYAQTAPWPLTPFYGTGSIDGFFSFHDVDAAALQAVLPKGMTLHPQALTPEGRHPIAMLANQQIGVRLSALPRFMGYRNYLEAIIAINFVQVEGYEGVFSYLPNLYLTNSWAKWAGVWMYGYNKRMGKLQMGHDRYEVATPDGAPIWSGRYQQKDFARPLVESPHCGLVQSISEQIVVTEGKFSKWQFSSFDFNLSSAYVAGVSAEIDVANASFADIPAGTMYARPLDAGQTERDESNKLPGAFRIWTSWTLSNPLDSRRLSNIQRLRGNIPH